MKKKSADLFAGFTLNDVVEKVFSSKKLQPMIDRTFAQMMKVKSRLDTVMPVALGAFNLPSAEDIRKLNNEVSKLDAKLETLSRLVSAKKKKKRSAKKMKRTLPPSSQEHQKDIPAPDTPEPQE